MATDRRVIQTRERIRAAVLDLVTKTPITHIEVTELAAAAGINRVTFYDHYSSPVDALVAAVEPALDALLDDYAPDDGDGVWERIEAEARVLSQHIWQFRQIYRINLDPSHGLPLGHVLANRIYETLTQRVKPRPDSPIESYPEEGALFVSVGLVAAVQGWLNVHADDEDEDAAVIALTEMLAKLTPHWWK